MISQTLRTIAVGSSKIADLGAAIDGSLKLKLQQMREGKEPEPEGMYCALEDRDNCIAAEMYGIYNFSRLRHADRIGVTYWMITCDDGQTLVPVDFFTMLDGKVHSIRRSNAILSGDLEFPANTWESDMECLATFVESSSKSKIVGQFLTLQNKMQAQEAQRIEESTRLIESFEPTGSHRAVDAMQGVAARVAAQPFNDTFNPYSDGEYNEAMEAAAQIEQYVESVPVAGKVRKNREKRIVQDTVSTESTNTGKSRRKSDKTVIDVAYAKNDIDKSKIAMPAKTKSRTSRCSSRAKIEVLGL